jgi:hypothetical protein
MATKGGRAACITTTLVVLKQVLMGQGPQLTVFRLSRLVIKECPETSKVLASNCVRAALLGNIVDNVFTAVQHATIHVLFESEFIGKRHQELWTAVVPTVFVAISDEGKDVGGLVTAGARPPKQVLVTRSEATAPVHKHSSLGPPPNRQHAQQQ